MATGEGDINNTTYVIDTEDLVIPLYARLVTPGAAGFSLGLGVDFIVPLSAELNTSGFGATSFGVEKRSVTTYFGMSVGVEIDAVVVKVPIELTFRLNTSMEDNYDDRLLFETQGNNITNYRYRSDWEYQGGIRIGVVYQLDVL